MIYLAAFTAVFFFVVAFEQLGVVRVSAEAVRVSREAAATVRDRSLGDDEKEVRLQRASLTLVKAFASIAFRSVGAFAAALVPLALFELTGLARFAAVTGWLATWSAILLTTAIVTLGYYLRHKLRHRH